MVVDVRVRVVSGEQNRDLRMVGGGDKVKNEIETGKNFPTDTELQAKYEIEFLVECSKKLAVFLYFSFLIHCISSLSLTFSLSLTLSLSLYIYILRESERKSKKDGKKKKDWGRFWNQNLCCQWDVSEFESRQKLEPWMLFYCIRSSILTEFSCCLEPSFLAIYISIYLSVSVPSYLSANLSSYQSICQSTSFSLFLSIHLNQVISTRVDSS